MKKVVRTVWISMLTGLAFLVACAGTGKLTRAEKKQLKNERTEIVSRLKAYADEERIGMENNLLDMGPSVILESSHYEALQALYTNRTEELALLERLVTIDQTLKNDKAAQSSQQRMDNVRTRMEMLQDAIESAIPPCLYGPPPTDPDPIFPNDEESSQAERQRKLDSIREARSQEPRPLVYGPPRTNPIDRQRADELNHKIDSLEKELNTIGAILQRREGACVYGSPEVIERYNKETERMRAQVQEIHKELVRLKNEKKHRGL